MVPDGRHLGHVQMKPHRRKDLDALDEVGNLYGSLGESNHVAFMRVGVEKSIFQLLQRHSLVGRVLVHRAEHTAHVYNDELAFDLSYDFC